MGVSQNCNLTTERFYSRYVSPFDPCKPIFQVRYSTPPPLYIGFQPPQLQQFSPLEALKAGTLWSVFYDPYGLKR